jgi:hypothetical protein
MARGYRSKRLARDAPSDDALPKRVQRVNANTLAEFTKQQVPLRRDKRARKKATKPIEPLKASLELIEALTSSLVESALRSSPLVVQEPPVIINSLLVRALKNITITLLLFNLIIESKLVYYILIFIILIINSNYKINNTFNYNININNVFHLY